jgi:hypothetical protein
MGLAFYGLAMPEAVAQENLAANPAKPKKNYLRLQWGLHAFSRQDQLLSPLIYSDVSAANLGITYERTGEKAKNTAVLLFDRYTPTAHAEYTYTHDGRQEQIFPTFTTVVSLRYGHARRPGNGSWFTGLMSDNQVKAGEQGYGAAATFHYLGAFSLSPWLSYDRPLTDRLHLSLQTWVPLVAWVTRSPYALNDDQYMRDNANHKGVPTFFNYVAGGRLQTLNHWRKINFTADATYSLSPRIGVVVSYQAEALRLTQPRTLTSYQQYFNTGFQFSF